jgi:hypothetical protein
LAESLRVVRYLSLDAVHDACVPRIDVAGWEDHFGVWVDFEEFFGEEDSWYVGDGLKIDFVSRVLTRLESL